MSSLVVGHVRSVSGIQLGAEYDWLTQEKAERPDMSGLGARHVRLESLESRVEAGHIRLPKPDSLVCKTEYSSFDRNEN
jgi:hypothetical protein